MVKVTLLSLICAIITVTCSGCFQYPVSPWRRGTGRIELCVHKSAWEAIPKSLKKRTERKHDLKVTLWISPFQKLTFSLYYSAQCFALQWKSFFPPLRNKLFPPLRKHEYCIACWIHRAQPQLLSQNIVWVWSAVVPPMNTDRMINTLI